jgi:hypothetical protein
MDIDISPQEAMNSLKQLMILDTENQNIFSVQDSMVNHNIEDTILNLKITSPTGVPDLLYSEEIYNTEKEIGIEMPVDRLLKTMNQTTILIGVSGCGKTRTCYDLCRKYWGLYFDCVIDIDFNAMIDNLESSTSPIKTEETQKKIEKKSKRLIKCLIAARLLVLQTLREHDPNLQCFEWLCIQRSRRSKIVFPRFLTSFLYSLGLFH